MLHDAAGMITKVATIATLLLAFPAIADEPAGVTLEIERVVEGSREQILAWAGDAYAEIQANVRALTRLDADARKKSKGGEGLPCVSTALEAARALQESTADTTQAAEGALDEGNQRMAVYQMRKLSVAVGETRTLRAEAERCARGSGIQAGNSRTTVQAMAATDALTALPSDILSYAFDPPQASPF
jgi:hypothetical protein